MESVDVSMGEIDPDLAEALGGVQDVQMVDPHPFGEVPPELDFGVINLDARGTDMGANGEGLLSDAAEEVLIDAAIIGGVVIITWWGLKMIFTGNGPKILGGSGNRSVRSQGHSLSTAA